MDDLEMAKTKTWEPGTMLLTPNGRAELVDNSDPALVTCRSKYGVLFKVGRRNIKRSKRK